MYEDIIPSFSRLSAATTDASITLLFSVCICLYSLDIIQPWDPLTASNMYALKSLVSIAIFSPALVKAAPKTQPSCKYLDLTPSDAIYQFDAIHTDQRPIDRTIGKFCAEMKSGKTSQMPLTNSMHLTLAFKGVQRRCPISCSQVFTSLIGACEPTKNDMVGAAATIPGQYAMANYTISFPRCGQYSISVS